jgi:ATP dependent DNA ligase C terminal region
MRVGTSMDQAINAFDLSPEQQETASLLQRLLGNAVASRYVDFCRLAAGAFALNVSRPMAAHALRELDSMLRGALEVPMEARASETAQDRERVAQAREQLRALGFEDQAVNRAARELKPHLNHKQQIRQIVSRLGLAPDGDIANLWTSLTESFGRAHERSFHRSLKVDDDFREQYQRPFDTVIRAIAVALQGRYVALKRAASFYYSGKRTREWLKFKAVHEQEVVIVGYTEPRRSRKYFGSLVLAVRDKAGKRWVYGGHVGTGFDHAALKSLYGTMQPLRTGKKPFDQKVKDESTTTRQQVRQIAKSIAALVGLKVLVF